MKRILALIPRNKQKDKEALITKAKKALAAGFSVEDICKATELKEEEFI